MHCPVFETLHMTHVLLQTSMGLLTGSNQKDHVRSNRCWTRHVLNGHPEGAQDDEDDEDVMIFLRVEFQDGVRKDSTQDYHGSGRPHTHEIHFVDDMKALRLHEKVSVSVPPPGDDLMRNYVMSGQLDRKSTPWPIHEGPSRWDPATKTYRLHHTAEDHGLKVRAFFEVLLEGLKGMHQESKLAFLRCQQYNDFYIQYY
jgi:hypothetical protein